MDNARTKRTPSFPRGSPSGNAPPTQSFETGRKEYCRPRAPGYLRPSCHSPWKCRHFKDPSLPADLSSSRSSFPVRNPGPANWVPKWALFDRPRDLLVYFLGSHTWRSFECPIGFRVPVPVFFTVSSSSVFFFLSSPYLCSLFTTVSTSEGRLGSSWSVVKWCDAVASERDPQRSALLRLAIGAAQIYSQSGIEAKPRR